MNLLPRPCGLRGDFVRRSVLAVALVSTLASAIPPPDVTLPGESSSEVVRIDRPTDTTPASAAFPTRPRSLTGSVAGTGADACHQAVVVPVAVGPPGVPTEVTLSGGGHTVSGPECDALFEPVWWEAFAIDKCADVTISFCGTFPRRRDSLNFLAAFCAADGSSCRPILIADAVLNGFCPDPDADFNPAIRFNALPPGTYYYPLLCLPRDPDSPECSPYAMHILAEECTGDCSGCFGACCDTIQRNCRDGVAGSECQGSTQRFTLRAECCDLECRPAVTDYDAYGVKLLSHLPPALFPSGSTRANDCWGYVSPGEKEYAILGLNRGTGFVDITDPASPVIVADIPDAPSTWSDMQTYDHYCYNVNESDGGVQIIDLERIDEGAVTLIGSAAGGMRTAHDLEINPKSGFLYPCGTDIVRGFLVFDLANPADPQPVGSWNEVYVHDLYVDSYDVCPYAGRSGPCEIAFAFVGGSGLKVIDVTNKQNMQTLATLRYPNTAYCHQGWPSVDRKYMFIDDEFDENSFNLTTTTYVVDIQDVAHPTFVTSFTTGLCSVDHNLMVRGDRLFEADYTTGLQVFDIREIMNVRRIAFFDTRPESNRSVFQGAWGVYSDFPSGRVVLADIERGLFVFSLCEDLPSPRADFDGSGGVDLRDVAYLQVCFGKGVAGTGCDAADTDCDREVDRDDAAQVQQELTGP